MSLRDKLEISWRYLQCDICKIVGVWNLDDKKHNDYPEYDHLIARAMGGTDANGNLRPIHRSCHLSKTRGRGQFTGEGDVAKIASARAALCRPPPRPPHRTRKIPSRPFPKKGKKCQTK